MSKSGIPIVKDVAKVAGSVLKPITGLFSMKIPELPDPAPLPERGDTQVAKHAEQVATREQSIRAQAAAAAGAVRSENDADLLGYSAPKKRAASRSLLGA